MVGRLVGFVPYAVWGIFTGLKGWAAFGDNADIFWIGLVCIASTDIISFIRATMDKQE